MILDIIIEPDINIPTFRQAPRPRSETKGVIASFYEAVEGLFVKANTNSNIEDITNRLTKLSIYQKLKKTHLMLYKTVQEMMVSYFQSFPIKRWFPCLPSLYLTETACIKEKRHAPNNNTSYFSFPPIPTATCFRNLSRGN